MGRPAVPLRCAQTRSYAHAHTHSVRAAGAPAVAQLHMASSQQAQIRKSHYMVDLLSEYTRVLTFENFCQRMASSPQSKPTI